jgi:hypothetical protein
MRLSLYSLTLASLALAACSTCPAKGNIWGCAKGDVVCQRQEKLRQDAQDQLQPDPLREELERINRGATRG